jgi:excisionase family DNA binding protein
MTTIVFDPTDPVTPTEADSKLARESARTLVPQLAKGNGTVQLSVVDEAGGSETVTIPAVAFRLLIRILVEMASGNAVRIIPHHAQLTTQEAAELLNVSRPYLIRLLDDGRIPFHRVGTHRRILFKDLMTYRAEHRRVRRAALDELTRLDQELGLR